MGVAVKAGVRKTKGSIDKIVASYKELTTSMRHTVARESAPRVTTLADRNFDASLTVYDQSRSSMKWAAGKQLSLHKTGLTRNTLRFQESGTLVRCVLAKNYMRYLIGKYEILPPGNKYIPPKWRAAIDSIVRKVKAP
jgi:hypothetical protein